MAQLNSEFVILSDVTVPSGQIADKGVLEHHVVVRDSDGNFYTVVVLERDYSPDLVMVMATQQKRLKAMEQLKHLLRAP